MEVYWLLWEDESRFWLLPRLPDIAYGWSNDVMHLIPLTDDFEILWEMYSLPARAPSA